MSTENVVCSACGKQKASLSPVRSKLLPTTLLLCRTCKTGGFEPRYAIVIAGRSSGPEAVKHYIQARKYHGEEITAAELFS